MSIYKYTTATKEIMKELYEEKGLSILQIAADIDMPLQTVRNYLNRYDIKLRPPKKGFLSHPHLRQGVLRKSITPFTITEEELRGFYIINNHCVQEIAEITGISVGRIRVAMLKWDIPVRDNREARNNSFIKGRSGKGGRHYNNGYVLIRKPDHPRANKDGYIPEHRLVAETNIGRDLLSTEEVHHLNGIKDDNRPENLTVVLPKDHEKHTFLKRLQARIIELENVISNRR